MLTCWASLDTVVVRDNWHSVHVGARHYLYSRRLLNVKQRPHHRCVGLRACALINNILAVWSPSIERSKRHAADLLAQSIQTALKALYGGGRRELPSFSCSQRAPNPRPLLQIPHPSTSPTSNPRVSSIVHLKVFRYRVFTISSNKKSKRNTSSTCFCSSSPAPHFRGLQGCRAGLVPGVMLRFTQTPRAQPASFICSFFSFFAGVVRSRALGVKI